MNEQEFHSGSVPVAVVARVYGKDASWVRAGIISGWLPIGKATRNAIWWPALRRWIPGTAGSISTSRQSDCTRKPDISGEENDDEK